MQEENVACIGYHVNQLLVILMQNTSDTCMKLPTKDKLF